MTTNHAGPGDIETLNINTEFVHDHNKQESVFIAVLPEKAETASLILTQFNKEWKATTLQACLSLEEINLVIDGLALARFRMEILQMEDGPEKTLMLEVTKEWSIGDWNVARSSVGDLYCAVSDCVKDLLPLGLDLSTKAGISKAKFYFKQYVGY